ncbi:MAG: exodeoxyribonuclease VII large subunit [Gammaproteobacteria bacterium]|nr:exodeoxyribonuclease VII large subunit [Gammaproteobacteria bacterium]
MLANYDDHPVLSVSELAHEARLLIEQRFNLVWVEGEISNFRRPGSGHWYFTLKDSSAQVRCAMFAGRNRNLRFGPEDGTQVIVRGRVSLYEARGDFQIIAEHMELAGEGALRAAFEALKVRLDGEGLFAEERKQPLPEHPAHLAIISSASGAALQDVLHVIERRFPAMAVTLLPVAVQGDGAEAQILAALARAPLLDPDVVLLTRGGGSLEDLWTFNLESVARAVAACPIPSVVAVGHQTDFTIAEFVADLRAPTPSAAAELITPDAADLQGYLAHLEQRLARNLRNELRFKGQSVERCRAGLIDPRQRLVQSMQRADDLEERLQLALKNQLQRDRTRMAGLARSLRAFRPEPLLERHGQRLRDTGTQLGRSMTRAMFRRRETLAAAGRTLNAVSPLQTLERGYAVLTKAGDGEIGTPVTSIAATQPGAILNAHLRDGTLRLNVEQTSAVRRFAQVTNDPEDADANAP